MAVTRRDTCTTVLENDHYTVEVVKKGTSVRYVSDVSLVMEDEDGDRQYMKLPLEHMADFYDIVEALKEQVSR